jgi:hypothetical protein
VLVLLGLVIAAPFLSTGHAAAAQPATYQVAEPPQGIAQPAEPPPGVAYTDIAPDGTCASGFTAFVIAHGVRECYTPDPVVENENLQDRCPTDPSLYVCPGQGD